MVREARLSFSDPRVKLLPVERDSFTDLDDPLFGDDDSIRILGRKRRKIDAPQTDHRQIAGSAWVEHESTQMSNSE